MRPRTASFVGVASVLGPTAELLMQWAVRAAEARALMGEHEDAPFSRTINIGVETTRRFMVGETWPVTIPGFEGAKLIITAIDRLAGTITFGAQR